MCAPFYSWQTTEASRVNLSSPSNYMKYARQYQKQKEQNVCTFLFTADNSEDTWNQPGYMIRFWRASILQADKWDRSLWRWDP